MTTPDPGEDFTELIDFRPDRVDLVGKGANGIPRFLIAKQDASAGVLEPGFVRDLIAKSGPGRQEAELQNGITLSGSPAQMAAFIHAASVRKADMGTGSINDLPDSAFAFIEDGGKKDADGKTTPRSLRHFPIQDAAHVRNALSRAPQSPFGDKAMPKIRSAAKRFGIDVAKEAGVADQVTKDMMDAAGDTVALDDGEDGLDPTVPLAAPEEMGPGDPTDPGSPAWESIDAATAQKWLSIAARLSNVLCILAEREMLEAASADPSDAENAFDLEDAKCAVEYAIERLAVFAAGEQAEADLGAEMEAVGKALAGFDTEPLGVIEGLTAVRKAGRVLSSANEAAIRAAAESLQKVLASLPEAPIAKQKEGTVPGTQTAGTAPAAPVAKETPSAEAQARDAGPVKAGGTTGLGEPRATGPAAALPGDGPQQAMPGDVTDRTVVKSGLALVYDRAGNLVGVTDAASIVHRVAKADDGEGKKAMQAVFDQDGDLIGIVDPDAIQPVTGAGGKPAADGMDGDGMQDGPAAAAAPDDMTPQPPADAGTPADEVGKAADEDVITVTRGVLKSTVAEAVAAALGAMPPAQDVAKQADVAGTLAEVELLKARLATVESTTAPPKVFTNGQVPPAHQLRGQDKSAGGQQVDVAKAMDRRRQLYQAPNATEQNRVAQEMQVDAVEALAAIHRR